MYPQKRKKSKNTSKSLLKKWMVTADLRKRNLESPAGKSQKEATPTRKAGA